jgi:hypothetical protein
VWRGSVGVGGSTEVMESMRLRSRSDGSDDVREVWQSTFSHEVSGGMLVNVITVGARLGRCGKVGVH